MFTEKFELKDFDKIESDYKELLARAACRGSKELSYIFSCSLG
jgi:hypothetical protein